MGADFTPQMHYIASRRNPELYTSQLTFHIVGQEPVEKFTKEQLELMKQYVARTMRPEVLGGIGGFSGAFSLGKIKDMKKHRP